MNTEQTTKNALTEIKPVLYTGFSICKNRNCNNSVLGRKKYCSSFCQFIERELVKDEEKGAMPKTKRNKKYFWAYTGSTYPKGQGKRIGGMITGGLTGHPIPNYSIQETTIENLTKHFSRPCVGVADLGDGSRLLKQDFESHSFDLACI